MSICKSLPIGIPAFYCSMFSYGESVIQGNQSNSFCLALCTIEAANNRYYSIWCNQSFVSSQFGEMDL